MAIEFTKKLTTFLVFVVPLIVQAQPTTFYEAKQLANHIYFDNHTELYCGCTYNRNKQIDLNSCGYKVRKNTQRDRANRVEWEHVVPAAVFGKQRQCWQKGKRKYCQKNDHEFAKIEADLHNLIPVIGEVNADRQDFMYGWLPGKPTKYGQCQTIIDFKKHKMMPRQEVRGIVARISLYMYDHYHLRLSKQDRQLFEAWNKSYPVSNWEKIRNQRTACVMGWGNEYISTVDLTSCHK